MERPSHIASTSQSFVHRLPLIALAVFLQVSLAWMLTNGLAERIARAVPDITFTPIPDKVQQHLPPPPPPAMPTHLQVVDVPPPIFQTARDETPRTVTPLPPQPPGGGDGTTAPDRAPVAIRATHTTPPYPATALRQGLEGQVNLRLAVTPAGRVASAEVVTSSGSEALDQAAQGWIVAHWTYRPATGAGQPVASQALATVTFNLKDAR